MSKTRSFKSNLKIVIKNISDVFNPVLIRIKQALFDPFYPRQTFSNEDYHISSGYYDLNPFDPTETKFLAIQMDAPLQTPTPGNTAITGYYELQREQPIFIKIGQTQTWNWQQGCRLQWYPSNNGNSIFYNVLLNDHYGAVVQDIKTGNISQTIDFPVYDLDVTGQIGLSLNFSRLQRLRPGYGYGNIPDTTEQNLIPKDDGIWQVGIDKNQASLLFSIAEIAAIQPHDSMINAQHYFNHISFNPSGNAFLFFHLWLDQNNHRHSRLFTASSQGNRLTLLNNIGPVSHYTWLSNERLIITTYVSQNQLRYLQYHYINGFEGIVGIDHLITDGHPTMKNGRFLITDTYPDKFREQNLFLFDTKTEKLTVVDRVYSPPDFDGEMRCDLHPRLSHSSNLVCIDIVKNAKRAIKVIDISKFYN
jgi:hypothetical protein